MSGSMTDLSPAGSMSPMDLQIESEGGGQAGPRYDDYGNDLWADQGAVAPASRNPNADPRQQQRNPLVIPDVQGPMPAMPGYGGQGGQGGQGQTADEQLLANFWDDTPVNSQKPGGQSEQDQAVRLLAERLLGQAGGTIGGSIQSPSAQSPDQAQLDAQWQRFLESKQFHPGLDEFLKQYSAAGPDGKAQLGAIYGMIQHAARGTYRNMMQDMQAGIEQLVSPIIERKFQAMQQKLAYYETIEGFFKEYPEYDNGNLRVPAKMYLEQAMKKTGGVKTMAYRTTVLMLERQGLGRSGRTNASGNKPSGAMNWGGYAVGR